MSKKLALQTSDVNTKLVEELLLKSDPSELFGRDGLLSIKEANNRVRNGDVVYILSTKPLSANQN